MTDVTISGEGAIDGSGDAWMQRGGRFGRRFGTTRPTTSFAARTPATRPYGQMRGRPRLICVSNCQHVTIADLQLRRQAVWCLHLLYSQDVTVRNLNINAMGLIPSSDGIDVDSCDGVNISHCEIACDDDDISIKSGKDADGARVNRPSQNITISDCTIGAGGGIAMGSEVTGGIRHVLVERCVFNGTDATARFKSQPSRGGVEEDIVFRDLTMNHVRWAFDFNLAWRLVGPRLAAAKALTTVHNVQLINCSGTAQTGGTIHGLPGGEFEDLKFVNCHITAQRGLRMDNVLRADTSGLDLVVAEGPMIIEGNTQGPATRP
jgi:exo-poly-alpha-galacturonosidase